MAADVAAVLGAVFRGTDTGVVLVGHSMGGALAALTAELMSGQEADPGLPRMLGLVLAASSGRLAAALIQDTEEAEAETSEQPSKRGKVEAGDSIQEEEESRDTEEAADSFKAPRPVEAAPPSVDRTPPETFTGPGVYRWRVDLARTEPHWTSWFQGL